MFSRYITFLLYFANAIVIFAQSPEQTYFDWAELPFSKEELAERRQKLFDTLKIDGKSGLAVIPAMDGFSHGETFRQADDFYYFTGLELPNSLLVLDLAKNDAMIFVPERDERFESTSRPNDFPGMPFLNDSLIRSKSGILLKNIDDFGSFLDQRSKENPSIWINSERPGSIVFGPGDYIATVSPAQQLLRAIRSKHPALRFENSYEAIAKVRMVKSPTEINIMRISTEINVKGIKTAAKAIKAGIDERYLEGVLEGDYKINGAQRLAFGSIIKSGPNSLWPWRILASHYNRRNRKLKNGDLVIFDVGCEYNQYVSDVGRTFPVSGKFSARQKEILAMEVDIADQIIDFIKPGITFFDLKKLCDNIIPKEVQPYMQTKLFFGHHLGLSTGDPNLQDAKLQPGMIFTVEPWYYNHDEQISVFTEDVILVTENGCENLSKDLPRFPQELEKLMKAE